MKNKIRMIGMDLDGTLLIFGKSADVIREADKW